MVRPMDDDDDDMRELNEAARNVVETVLAITDQVQPPENARAMLIGVAAILISRSMRDGQEPTADTINAVWKREDFPWQMVRSLQ
jgi:hypothetical protein